MEKKLKKILSSKLTINNGEYKKYIIHLTTTQIHSFYFRCHHSQFFKEGEKINLNYTKNNRRKPFVVFLNKSQIKDVNKAKRNQTKYTLLLTYKQLKKTCPFIIKINDKIEEIKKLIKKSKVDKKEDLIKQPKKPKKKIKTVSSEDKALGKVVDNSNFFYNYENLYNSLKKFKSRKKKPNKKKSIFDVIRLHPPLRI